jgi:SRSO17 transposase
LPCVDLSVQFMQVASHDFRDQLPGPDVWLLARRSPSAPDKLAYYLAYAPTKTSLATLVRVASSRYTVEQCIEEAKGEMELDEYEVRFWHNWYWHVTLSMMAYAWLASIRLLKREKSTPELMSSPN